MDKESQEETQREIPLLRAECLHMIMDTPKGRGIFAVKDIPMNTILDVSPVLVLSPEENKDHVCKTNLYNYTYNWPYRDPNNRASETEDQTSQPTTTQAVVFGLGSLFNHSRKGQNVGWIRDVEREIIIYKTLRSIRAGEELCISYGDRLTFVDVDEEMAESSDEDDGLRSMQLV